MGLLIFIFFLPKNLQEENDRLLHYLDPTSEIHLIKTVEKQLISEHLSQILTKGLDALLEGDRKPELKLMYSLVGKVAGGPQELKGKMCDYVKKRGRVIVVNPEKDKTMVQELLDFKEKLDLVMVSCFGSNEQFIGQAHHMFSRFLNLRFFFHKILFSLFFYKVEIFY